MADVIDRQAAIDVLKRDEALVRAFGYQHAIDEIQALPSAEPERKVGRWREVYAETDYRNGWIEFTCECCEYQHGLESGEYGWHYGDEIPWKFCPVCGAQMKGENDG